jgi:hypothetical protein
MSAQRAFIIDSNYLKVNYNGYIDNNIDDNSIESFILLAQDVNLQSVLGYNMYNYIISTLISDPTGNSFSSYYQYILINYIRPSVALWSIFQMYPSLLYKATNKALVTKHSDDSIATGIREMEYMRNQIRNNAEFYDSRIQEYITNNTNFFTEYYTTSGVNRIKPKSQVYFGGLYLNNSYKNCRIDKGIDLGWS